MPSLKKFARNVGRTARKGLATAGKAAGSVTRVIDRVPVVGRPLGLIYGSAVTGPLTLATNISNGARIDKAVLGHFKGELSRAKQLAPYVQAVVTFVPGIGQGVGAAIGAGVALADGRPLSDAVVAGIRGALPGGPAAQAAFELGRAAISGEKIDASTLGRAAMAALPLSPQQRDVLTQGLVAARDIAQGKPVDQAVFARAQALLPPDAQKAVSVGLAVAQGQKLQNAVTQAVGPQTLAQLDRVGAGVLAKHDVLRAGAQMLKGPAQRSGFAIGAGLAAHKNHAIDRVAVRAKLDPQARVGFDLAVASYRGLANASVAAPPAGMSASSRLGYYANAGLGTIPPARRAAVARAVAVAVAVADDGGFDGLFDGAVRWEAEQARGFTDDFFGYSPPSGAVPSSP